MTSKNNNATTSNNGTNATRTVLPDQPMSWNLDTWALSITTATAINTSPCDKCGVRPGSIEMFATAERVASTIPPPRMDATHQNKNSSLPIRLDIMIDRSNTRLTSPVFFGNCSTVQVRSTGHLPTISRVTRCGADWVDSTSFYGMGELRAQ